MSTFVSSPVSRNLIIAPPPMGASEHVPLSSPDISDEDRARVLQVLNGPALSLGPMLPAFEKAAAAAAGTRFAIAVNSGTSGLHLCVKGAGIGPGDEVITTPFSFVASANCILFERATPKFVDIDINTYNMNPALIRDAINGNTRGILPVHVFGRPCEMDRIMPLAERFGLNVIEDACEAIGARIGARRAGSFGHSGVFAFYPNKQITTGEGGIILTDDEQLARLCRSWRNQGRGDGAGWLQHERLGYNYRLSDINCALGIGQILRISKVMEMRRRVAAHYNQLLSEVDELILPAPAAKGTEVSWFVYVVRLQEEFTRTDRDQIMEDLRADGIGCNNYFTPIHLQPFYKEQFGFRPGDFPVTEHVAERTIALPFFNHLSQNQMEIVAASLTRAIGGIKSSSISMSMVSKAGQGSAASI